MHACSLSLIAILYYKYNNNIIPYNYIKMYQYTYVYAYMAYAITTYGLIHIRQCTLLRVLYIIYAVFYRNGNYAL